MDIYAKRQIENIFYISSMYTFFNKDIFSDSTFDGQRHDFWEINLVTSGKIELTCEDKIFNLEKGQLYFIRPNAFHKPVVLNGSKAKIAIVSFDLAIENISFDDTAYTLNSDDLCLFNIFINEFENFCLKSRGVTYMESAGIPHELPVPQIIADMLQVLIYRILLKSSDMTVDLSKKSPLYSAAVGYMRENINRKLELEQISRACGVSKTVLKDLFKKNTGGGVIEYFTNLKIEYSKKLLLKNTPIGKIADDLSFSSQCYYSLVFKKICGMSPMQYRKSNDKD